MLCICARRSWRRMLNSSLKTAIKIKNNFYACNRPASPSNFLLLHKEYEHLSYFVNISRILCTICLSVASFPSLNWCSWKTTISCKCLEQLCTERKNVQLLHWLNILRHWNIFKFCTPTSGLNSKLNAISSLCELNSICQYVFNISLWKIN